MIPIVTPGEMRAIDAAASEPIEELIGRASWYVARRAREMLGGVYGRRVTVIAGPGNNGEDGRVAAQILRRWGVRVQIVSPDATELPAADLLIDGAFGTGMNRAYVPTQPAAGTPVLAIDIPSGVDGLTGECRGVPIRADHTVTFAALKPGLLLEPGVSLCGQVEVVDLGLDVSGATAGLFTDTDARELLPQRAPTDHKWKRAVWVIGGSSGMYGAPMLAANAALRSGSGIVRYSVPGGHSPSSANELVFHGLDAIDWHADVRDNLARFGALVVGPGLEDSPESGHQVRALLAATSLPVVLDATALRLLGEAPTLRPNVVITPHDGEFEALTGARPGADRFAATRALATTTGATVLLKGPTTIVASPNGNCLASNSGDQRLATAGSGDVLAGMIASYLAAGLDSAPAAALGAWMHGQAGRSQPAFGMVASDLVAALPTVAAQLMAPAPTERHGILYASN